MKQSDYPKPGTESFQDLPAPMRNLSRKVHNAETIREQEKTSNTSLNQFEA